MRFSVAGLLAGGALFCAALASPPISGELMLPLAGKAYVAPDEGAGIPSVARGQALGIACAEASRAGADVRVVMQVDADSDDDDPAGFGAVLATDQKVERGTVHVRVPNMPDLSHRTVNVKVFVMDSHGTHTCDAGRVRIG